jgi:hypothetical protein
MVQLSSHREAVIVGVQTLITWIYENVIVLDLHHLDDLIPCRNREPPILKSALLKHMPFYYIQQFA